MVTAPLAPRGVQVDVPEHGRRRSSRAARRWRCIERRPDFLDDQAVAPGALGPLLRRRVAASREQGGPRVFLRADRALDYGRVMSVMGEINRAGLRRVALVSTGSGER